MNVGKTDCATRTAQGSAGLTPQPGDALLIIDLQNDFLPGGAMAVPGGDTVIAPLNGWIARFARAGLPVLATRDRHPSNHCSFREQGGPWPVHCVAHTPGAMTPTALNLPPSALIVDKPCHSQVETYSGFDGTSLEKELRRAGIKRLWVGGLATDYCVLNTVLAALDLGFEVVLLTEAMRAVEVEPGDGQRALSAMIDHGAVIREE